MVAIAALGPAACGGDEERQQETITIAVNAPFSRTSYVGEAIARGASLAVQELNAGGGVPAGSKVYKLEIQRLDNALSPGQAVANVRSAVNDGAVAILDDDE